MLTHSCAFASGSAFPQDHIYYDSEAHALYTDATMPTLEATYLMTVTASDGYASVSEQLLLVISKRPALATCTGLMSVSLARYTESYYNYLLCLKDDDTDLVFTAL